MEQLDQVLSAANAHQIEYFIAYAYDNKAARATVEAFLTEHQIQLSCWVSLSGYLRASMAGFVLDGRNFDIVKRVSAAHKYVNETALK